MVPARRPPPARPPAPGTDPELEEMEDNGDDDGDNAGDIYENTSFKTEKVPLERVEAAYSKLRAAQDGIKREHDVSPLVLTKRN